MRTALTSLVSPRILRSPSALGLTLALSLTACDGVDDPAAPADEAEAVESPDQDYVDPPLSAVEVEAPTIVEDEAAGPALAASQDFAAPIDPTALCFWYSERKSLDLYSYGNKLYGNVKLYSNCNNAYATTTVTDPNVAYWQRRTRVSMQYWNGSAWITTAASPYNWTSAPAAPLSTVATSFATGTFVRACGQIEGASPSPSDLDSTGYYCTDYWQISSST